MALKDWYPDFESDPGFEEFREKVLPQLVQQPKGGDRRAYGLFNSRDQKICFSHEYGDLFRRTVGEGRKLQGDLFKRELLGEDEPRDLWEIVCVIVDRDLNVRIEETDGVVSTVSSHPYLRNLARRIADYVETAPALKEQSRTARVAVGLELSVRDLNHAYSSPDNRFQKGDLVIAPASNGDFVWGAVVSEMDEDAMAIAVDMGSGSEQLFRTDEVAVASKDRLEAYAKKLLGLPATPFDLRRARTHPDHRFSKGEVVVVRRNDGSYRYGQVFGESPTIDSYLVVVSETRDWKDVPISEIGKLVDPIAQAERFIPLGKTL